MIECKELVELQIQAIYGNALPDMIKQVVNRELDSGIWLEGYEIAVSKGELEKSDAHELLDIVLSDQPRYAIDSEALVLAVKKLLPQTTIFDGKWLVLEDGTFLMTDSLRVARFENSNAIWCTNRISLDGVEFQRADLDKVFGLAWHGGDSYSPDSPFVLNLGTGSSISGVTEYE